VIELRKLGGCKPLPPRVRFEESYMPEPNSGCWLWLGRERGSNGYGGIKADGAYWVAHRYSWHLHCGEIPAGALVCHKCDNPACVNPKHLFLGSNTDNVRDMHRKGRWIPGQQNPARGATHPLAKLTEDIVLGIRSDKRAQRAIAKEFGVSQTLVWRIKAMKTWSHL
jgi:hypothetical protein